MKMKPLGGARCKIARGTIEEILKMAGMYPGADSVRISKRSFSSLVEVLAVSINAENIKAGVVEKFLRKALDKSAKQLSTAKQKSRELKVGNKELQSSIEEVGTENAEDNKKITSLEKKITEMERISLEKEVKAAGDKKRLEARNTEFLTVIRDVQIVMTNLDEKSKGKSKPLLDDLINAQIETRTILARPFVSSKGENSDGCEVVDKKFQNKVAGTGGA